MIDTPGSSRRRNGSPGGAAIGVDIRAAIGRRAIAPDIKRTLRRAQCRRTGAEKDAEVGGRGEIKPKTSRSTRRNRRRRSDNRSTCSVFKIND